jgi:hypothetical protein
MCCDDGDAMATLEEGERRLEAAYASSQDKDMVFEGSHCVLQASLDVGLRL